MARTIGDLLFGFRGDGKQLKIDAIKHGGIAGEAAGKTFSQKFATGVKTAGGAIAGGLGAALLIGTTARLRDLEAATADFRRETGATAEEATRAGQAINDMAGRNLQPIEEIGRTLTAVTVQWGLTGDAAAAAAEDVLQFARATGMNAEDAVNGLDNVMDSWNLTTERSQELMDKLIVSHQRWGGDIDQNIDSLAGLAPAMQAANFEVEDGIALLGLFGSKGLDANQGAAAFAKALTKVKSPQELQDLITDISNTTDKFDRARKAANLFGARAGAKLANALGGVNLDDYAVSMEDAAGATDKAADASLTMADKVQMAFRNITSDVVKLLGENGTLLQGIAGMTTLIGPLAGAGKKMGVALGAAIGAAILPKIAAAMSLMGIGDILAGSATRMGARLGRVMGLAMGAGIVVGLAAVADEVSGPANQLGRDINKWLFPKNGPEGMLAGTIADSLGDAFHEAWYQMNQNDPLRSEAQKAIERQAHDAYAGATPAITADAHDLGQRSGGSFADGIADGIADAEDTLAAAAGEAGHDFTDDWLAAAGTGFAEAPPEALAAAVGSWGESLWQGAVPRMVAAQAAAWEAALAEGRAKTAERSREAANETAGTWVDGMVGALRSGAGNVAGGLAQVVAYANERAAAEAADLIPSIKSEIRSRLDQVRDVMQDLRYAITHPWTGIREAVAIEAALSSSAMRKGLKSQDPAIRAEAEDRKRFLEARLAEIVTTTDAKAFLASKALRRGLKSKDPEVREEWRERRRFAKSILAKMETDATSGGSAQGKAYGDGLITALDRAQTKVSWSLGSIAALLGGSLPEAGPLVGVEKGGASVGKAWLGNLRDTLADGRSTLEGQLGGMGSALRLSPMSVSASVAGGIGPIDVGQAVVRHEHHISTDGARILHDAGYNEHQVAGFMLASPDQAIRRWEDG